MHIFTYTEFDDDSNFWRSERQFRFFIRRICKTSSWFWFVIVLVFLNTCTVAVEHYNQPQWLTEFLFYAEFIFLGCFILEILIRLYALGPRTYFSTTFNVFDCFVIVGSIVEVIWVHFKDKGGSFGLSALRALRLLRVFKVTKYWSSLRTPTSNFNTITSALLTVFQVLTGEDWNQVMYTAIDSKGGRKGGGMVYSLYFVMLTLCGDYTLLNVFLAIACDSLDQAAALTEAEEAEKERHKTTLSDDIFLDMEVHDDKENKKYFDPIKAAEIAFEKAAEAAVKSCYSRNNNRPGRNISIKPILPYSSFFILSSSNPIRVSIHWLVTKKVFDCFIMCVIVLSSIALASEDPVDENSIRNKLLGYADYGFTTIFTLELVSCALISFYHTLAGTPTGQKLKSLKLLRVLRPLKTINRVPKLKAVFDCVVISLKNVFNILIVYMLFQIIFAIVGVQLFNGKFFFCSDESRTNADECHQVITFHYEVPNETPKIVERTWERRSFHYDNCFRAIITLFAIQTSEGWVAILQDSMASTYENEGPKPWYRVEMSIFYIVFFVVFFFFFFVNIFVALIIVTFNELGEAELQDNMDKNQKSCIDFAIQARPLELYVPQRTDGFYYHAWRLITSSPFENFIMVLIICNTILLMLKFHGAPIFFMDILSGFNLLFTFLFTIECILKVVSYGPKSVGKPRVILETLIRVTQNPRGHDPKQVEQVRGFYHNLTTAQQIIGLVTLEKYPTEMSFLSKELQSRSINSTDVQCEVESIYKSVSRGPFLHKP
ncbi:CACNA1B [Lepeophtheirus salmonis]|uniref:CACNA1B n=1 Tax=Lepeophtheirus salmonis TaxID=72036 RepID=A0A7R8H208_LEPSM|nr:CACNA1B [Lepeophtheirus salmonis]CAF2820635.1 CACNA1B [Lepeophtheirus salmonis]